MPLLVNIWKYDSRFSHKVMLRKFMKSQENPTIAENTPDYMNPQKPRKSEPVTQVQIDNVITSKDLPSRRVRYGLPLFILAIFLFVTALYYGIINP